MSYVYILKSARDGNLYVGTTDDIVVRLQMHNDGKVKSTRSRRPLFVVYTQRFTTLSEARAFEWKLKYTPWGGKLKKQLVSSAAGSANGRPIDSESINLGSNPSPAAEDRRHDNS